ncbi:MAG: tetratricopeptide repeat protein [candidate division Zixibacteria bacterium]|nr:tetratricopeptide repeat protein [candidate division Zixibacteria bacterium]
MPRKLITLTALALVVCLLLIWNSPGPDTIPITTRSATALIHFTEGRNLFEQNRKIAAESSLHKALDLDPRLAMAHLYLSRIQTNGNEARNSLARAVSLANEVSDGERLMILADRAGSFQQPARQHELLSKLTETYSGDARVHLELGLYFFRLKHWDSAIISYSRAVALSPTYASAYNGMGYCYRFLGNLCAAEECFLNYMSLIPDAPNPYDSYADLLTKMNRHREAIQFYKEALKVQPDFVASHLGIANNLCVLGQHKEAREQLGHLLEIAWNDDQRRAALQGIMMSYLDQGNFEAAFEQFETAHQIAIAAADTVAMAQDLDAMGKMWLEIDRSEEASKAFTASLNLIVLSAVAPSVAEQAQLDHYQRQALVWLQRGNIVQAQDIIQQYQAEALRTKDQNRIQTAHETLGRIALESGDIQQAIKELSESDLEQALNQYYLALAYEVAGDLPQALRLYIKASTYDQFGRLGQAFVRQKALRRVESLRLVQEPHQEVPVL